MGSAISVRSGSGAPTDATYLVQTASGGLSAEQAMGALATGLVKNTTTTGVQLIATPGRDYGLNCWMHDAFAGLTGSVIGAGAYNETGVWADDTLTAGSTATASGGILTLTNNAAAGATRSTISSTVTNGTFLNGGCRVHFKFRADQNATGNDAGFEILSGSTILMAIYLRGSTDQLDWYNGANADFSAAAINTWYTVDAFLGPTGSTAGPVEIFLDGAYVYRGTLNTSATAWNKIAFFAASPAGGADTVLDVDDFYIYSAMPLFGI